MPFKLDPAKKIPKKIVRNSKNLKTTFRHYFQPKRDEIGQEREKKNLLPKKIAKKLKKLKNLFPTLFLAKRG